MGGKGRLILVQRVLARDQLRVRKSQIDRILESGDEELDSHACLGGRDADCACKHERACIGEIFLYDALFDITHRVEFAGISALERHF